MEKLKQICLQIDCDDIIIFDNDNEIASFDFKTIPFEVANFILDYLSKKGIIDYVVEE